MEPALGKYERATRAGGSGGGFVACMLSLVLRVSTRRCASGVLQHSGETMDEPALLWQVRIIHAGHLQDLLRPSIVCLRPCETLDAVCSRR